MSRVRTTSFDEEQREKDEGFLKLTGEERLQWLLSMQALMRKASTDKSSKGNKVVKKKTW
jgi:hypothetical protein